ncbi:phytoene desaturase family protein [Herbiconiux daphne]|uniref:NAD(P)/FAD-dependent oxidoreductase n=1 Tax=Herbiconiux daphne TaxID=2970914 RepID=A0ABT2H8D3_9MICO|nr:NAD(P)/FAD-dependent oxidoreductase [Herbiconiux daphne]MCS5736152.1 NAD(P)/FAD-dependent oxidoreductase [Herbiconiux daphne]
MGTGPVDVAVVGSGPNGLAAAVTMARAGLSVRVFEAAGAPGGGARSAELTLAGHLHDVCSAVHPMALASPFFQAFGLDERVSFAIPDVSYAQVLAGGRAALAWRDLERTADGLGADGEAWRRLFAPLVRHHDAVVDLTMGPLVRRPRHPVVAAEFGARALATAGSAAAGFSTDAASGLLAGVSAHSIGRVGSLGARGTALLLGTLAHTPGGWPIPVGGSQAIVDALVADLVAHGGEVVTETRIDSLHDLPSAHAVLLDVTPRALDAIGGDLLPRGYRRALREFRYGDAASKVDFVLDGEVPWADAAVALAGTVHLGGGAAEVDAAEREVAQGRHPSTPFVLLSQPSAFDPGRAPEGHAMVWAYTHVPRGSGRDMTEAVTERIEQFAPGFRDRIVASAAIPASALQLYNANYVDGDIASGAATFGQLLARPVLSATPWRTPLDGVYLCSASTTPGPGVHGMAGWQAAREALRDVFGITEPPSLAP